MKNPKISFVICTYNNKELVKRCLDSIFSQSYKNFEIICVDGGSKDGTLDLLKEYNVKIIHNRKRFPEGFKMGKSQGAEKAKGEIIAFVDQDNKLIGKDCLKELVYPLIKDEKVFGAACKLYVDKKDNITNRYLSYIGTDPFAVYRSLEGRMALNKIKLKDEGRYYTYIIDKENCLCTGGNVFLLRKNLLHKIGGYVQDVEMIYSLCLIGINKLAIPKRAFTHHLTINSFKEFLKKRWYWGYHHSNINVYHRKYSWLPRTFNEFLIFSLFILSNLIIIPNLIDSLRKLIQTKDKAWLLNPIAMFLITIMYGIIFSLKFINRNS